MLANKKNAYAFALVFISNLADFGNVGFVDVGTPRDEIEGKVKTIMAKTIRFAMVGGTCLGG